LKNRPKILSRRPLEIVALGYIGPPLREGGCVPCCQEGGYLKDFGGLKKGRKGVNVHYIALKRYRRIGAELQFKGARKGGCASVWLGWIRTELSSPRDRGPVEAYWGKLSKTRTSGVSGLLWKQMRRENKKLQCSLSHGENRKEKWGEKERKNDRSCEGKYRTVF